MTRRTRDKDKTVQDILIAAKHLFSERGLYGTSIRDIENASGVSKGLILHHFDTKEKLYLAVQDQMIQEYVAMMDAQRQTSQSLRDLIAVAIRSSFTHTKGNRDYHRISLWSYLEGQERNTELEERFTMAIASAMRAGQQSGLVREDIDASPMPFIVKGTIDYWIRKDKLIRNLVAKGEDQKMISDDSLIDALTKLFLK